MRRKKRPASKERKRVGDRPNVVAGPTDESPRRRPEKRLGYLHIVRKWQEDETQLFLEKMEQASGGDSCISLRLARRSDLT